MSIRITSDEREHIYNHDHLEPVIDRLIAEVNRLAAEVATLKKNARS